MKLLRTVVYTVIILAVVVALIVLKPGRKADDTALERDSTRTEQRNGDAKTWGDSPTAVALDEAKEDGRPVWLLIHAAHCQPCTVMKDISAQIAPDFEGKVSFLSADFDDPDEEDLMKFLNVRFVPTSVFMDSSGKVETKVGQIPVDKLKQMLAALQK